MSNIFAFPTRKEVLIQPHGRKWSATLDGRVVSVSSDRDELRRRFSPTLYSVVTP